MRELTEKQAEFLDAATSIIEKRATDPGYQYWMTGDGQDESYSYCRECLFPEIGPRPESCSRGIGMEESDGVELCECCGVLLDYVLTDYGITDELFHFADTPESFDWNDPDQCYEVSRVANGVDDSDKKRLLIGILLKGQNFPAELKRIRVPKGYQVVQS